MPALSVVGAAGCVSVRPLPDAAPVLELSDPTTSRGYLLYVPSVYSDRRDWPLVVACHGTLPYDTAKDQMREWAQFGEDEGIIIAAPDLVGTRGDFPLPAKKQIAMQRRDEEAILSIVRSIKGQYRVAEEQVFLTAWSAGSFAVLHTGLHHPEVFRALAIRQGNFDENYMDLDEARLDRWQPIKIIYGNLDFLRDQTLACIKWLQDRNQYVDSGEITGSHRRIDPSVMWKFFQKIVRDRPWIRMSFAAVSEADPLSIRFGVECIPAGEAGHWWFGDGAESKEADPTHRYEAPGRYEVTVNVELESGHGFRRQRVIRVGP